MSRASPASQDRAGRASPRAGARLGHTATIADARIAEAPMCRPSIPRPLTPAETRREHALEDARNAYWSQRNRLLTEYFEASQDIERRFRNGEFDQ